MAEQKSWLKVQLSGMVEGMGTVDDTQVGTGVIVLVDDGKDIKTCVAGTWGPVELGTAIDGIKNGVGAKMFKDALVLYLANAMAKAFAGGDEAADEEAENEKKAAEAAGEAHDGEET